MSQALSCNGFSLWNLFYVISHFGYHLYVWHLWFCKALYKRAIMLYSCQCCTHLCYLRLRSISVSRLLGRGYLLVLAGHCTVLLLAFWLVELPVLLEPFSVHLSKHEITIAMGTHFGLSMCMDMKKMLKLGGAKIVNFYK